MHRLMTTQCIEWGLFHGVLGSYQQQHLIFSLEDPPLGTGHGGGHKQMDKIA